MDHLLEVVKLLNGEEGRKPASYSLSELIGEVKSEVDFSEVKVSSRLKED
jgi:hypothetical protein